MEASSDILAALRQISFGHLVTHTGDVVPGIAFMSTPLPFVIDDELSSVRAHFARANHHWRQIDHTDALLIVAHADAYISPRWYPSKAEHGKVVPTWNYEVIHLHGSAEIHDEAEWKLELVNDLTDHNEALVGVSDGGVPWEVSDAPSDFIDAQLKAIVGVELTVTSIDGKRKLSQNKPEHDRSGATEGLARTGRPGDAAVGSLMATIGSSTPAAGRSHPT